MKAGPAGGLMHVVGAGLAGLAAAVALAAAGREVRLYEASSHAGGRCRSYIDAELGCRIDNGNHLLLSGNRRAFTYLELIGARDTVEGPADAVFAFFDAKTGRRWLVRPNLGRVPWWILSRRRRVPDTRAADYLEALALWRAHPGARVSEVLDKTRPLFARLWQPLAVAALNSGVEEASARLLWRILSETLGRGGAACRPLVPRQGLSETFVDPALDVLRRRGARMQFGVRLRALEFAGDRLSVLRFDSGPVELAADDRVILATPAAVAARLVPGLTVPELYSPIVNAHFRCAAPPTTPAFVGVIGGTAEWIFRKPGVLSVTVSAAGRMVDRAASDLGQFLWRDVAAAYGIRSITAPPARIVKERRATFLASPDQLSRRPAATTRWGNLMLAGDYTDTGLPATIEGAIGSGFTAAQGSVVAGDAGSLPAKLQGAWLRAAIGTRIWREQTPKLQ
ncbi:MAG: FAD-dependent oxidoreductase [Alphaproteobacteria bacterium]|nr:FAD-dependent oxidoreductase [Alphaproteobacteria bacterium]